MKKIVKSFCALLLAAALLCACALPASAAMDDISGHWGEPAIQFCLGGGYMQGKSPDTFDPNGSVSRAQVVQVLYNMSGAPDVSSLENPFADSEAHWAKDAIMWARSMGVVQGVSDTAFAPEQPVSRQQVTTMFMRYAGVDASNTHNHFDVDTTVLSLYPDGSQVGSWYKDGVSWAVQYGFMQGSDGKLNPTGTLTRAQLAQFIQNYFQPLEGVQPPAPEDKYPTVEAFLADPDVKAVLEEALGSLEMDIELYGDEDTLYYDFYYGEHDLDGVDLDVLAAELEEQMLEESFANTYIGIAQAMTEVIAVENPKVAVNYFTYDGEWIYGAEYSAY